MSLNGIEKNAAEIEKLAPKLQELYKATNNGTARNKYFIELVEHSQKITAALQRFIAHVFDVDARAVGSDEVMFGTLYIDDAATDAAFDRIDAAIGGFDTIWDDAINTAKKDVKKIRNFLNTSTTNYYNTIDILSQNRGKSISMKRIGRYLR